MTHDEALPLASRGWKVNRGQPQLVGWWGCAGHVAGWCAGVRILPKELHILANHSQCSEYHRYYWNLEKFEQWVDLWFINTWFHGGGRDERRMGSVISTTPLFSCLQRVAASWTRWEESVGFSSLTKASFLHNVNYSFVPNGEWETEFKDLINICFSFQQISLYTHKLCDKTILFQFPVIWESSSLHRIWIFRLENNSKSKARNNILLFFFQKGQL